MCKCCKSRLVSWNILMISEGIKVTGVYFRMWVYKKQTEWRKKLELILILGIKIWLVTLVLGSSMALREEPSRLLGNGVISSRTACEQLNGLKIFTLSLLTLYNMTGCGEHRVFLAPVTQQAFLESCGADNRFLKTNHQLLSGVTRPSLVYPQ